MPEGEPQNLHRCREPGCEAGLFDSQQTMAKRGDRANDWIQREQYHAHTLTLKMRMGATHFLMKRLPKVATEMALHMFAYNLTRVMNIIGVQALLV